MDIRLVATDLDGTFLHKHFEFRPDDVETVAACAQRGIPVVAISGRNLPMVHTLMEDCGFAELAGTNNGASVVNLKTRRILHRNPIDPEAVARIVQYCQERNIELTVFGHEALFFVRPILSEYYVQRCAEVVKDPREAQSLILCEGIEDLLDRARYDAEKIHTKIPYEQGCEIMGKLLAEYGEMQFAASGLGGFHGLEICAPNANKGVALDCIAKDYGIDPSQVLAIGDNLNDTALLEHAGIGVAMGNGHPGLQAIADHVAPNWEQGGWSTIVREIVGL